jgi:hypothetical protein
MTRTTGRHWLGYLSFVLLLAGSGCGKHTPPLNDSVEGIAKIDGTPLVNVTIQFVPDGQVSLPTSSAITDEQGHFKLQLENGKPGAVLGKHHVVVLQGRGDGGSRADDPQAARGAEGGAPAPKGGGRRPSVPGVYMLAAKTPLLIDVTPDRHSYDLTLTTKP